MVQILSISQVGLLKKENINMTIESMEIAMISNSFNAMLLKTCLELINKQIKSKYVYIQYISKGINLAFQTIYKYFF